jgi:AAA15 family ATPase/GTPase
MISSISIKGFRGFAEEQELKLADPNGNRGSGLTVIVGPNNGGKSTIIESFKLMSSGNDISFAEGQRNKASRYNP